MAIHELKKVTNRKHHGRVFGGPFIEVREEAVRGDLTIKLAPEVRADATINVRIPDFSVPIDDQEIRIAVIAAAHTLSRGSDVYVGCMGGIGRTGTFMAILGGLLVGTASRDPVAWVRAHYIPHAVEKRPQERYVETFIQRNADIGLLCRAILRGPVTKPKKAKRTLAERARGLQSVA